MPAVKTEILNNLINKIKEVAPEFKYVVRGIQSIENLDFKTPLCTVSSLRTITAPEQVYGTTYLEMIVSIDIFHETKTDYFSVLDNLEYKIISLLTDYQNCKYDLHSNVLKVDFDESAEIINEEYLQGLLHLRIITTIRYTN